MTQLLEPKFSKMTVKPIYAFMVANHKTYLEFTLPGGIEAITVITEQYRDRLFALKDYPKEDEIRMRNVHVPWLAQDICTFVFTGVHPTEPKFNSDSLWGSPQSRDYAEQTVTRMIQDFSKSYDD